MSIAVEYSIKLLRREHLENEYYGFEFEKPEGFSFIEGQFGVFGLVDKEIVGRKLRAFSLASTNEDTIIRVATRISKTPSSYKESWLSMPLGDSVTMNAPKGDFVLDESQPAVFIAGGIGITPIRSMILSKTRNIDSRNDILIYSELESVYPYKSDVEQAQGLSVRYAADIEPTQSAIIEVAERVQNTALYYLSGSPGFVKGITSLLKDHNVLEERINFDVFVGY